LLLHVIAGGLALVSGAVAISAVKGATLHLKSGMLFVYAVLAMSVSGAVMAAFQANAGNVLAGLLTAYLAITALTTVRPRTARSRRVELGAMLVALTLGLASVTLALQALAAASGTRFGIPAPVFFMFGAIGLLGGLGDLRMIRSGGLRGAPRLARHLWRMCWALWIATASFFLGPRARVAKVLPEPLLTPAFLVLPVLLVFVAMLYWLWRVRVRRTYRGIGSGVAPDAV